MSEPTASPHQQDLILKARQAALLKIFVSGRRRLNTGELAELEGILPAKVLRRQPVERVAYLYPLSHYCATYERSLRLIKGWIDDGRSHHPDPILPPLDQPADMLAWWRIVKSNRPPDILVRLASEGSRSSTATLPASSVSTPSLAAAPPSSPPPASPVAPATPAVSPTAGLPFEAAATPPAITTPALPVDASSALLGSVLGQPVGYSAFLNRLRHAESNAGALYESLLADARAATDPETKIRLQAASDSAYASWTKVMGEMRKAEADAPKILAASGKAWDADAVLASLEAIMLIQKSGMVQLVRNVRPKLRACTSNAAEDAVWAAAIDKIFSGWNATQFAAAVADHAD